VALARGGAGAAVFSGALKDDRMLYALTLLFVCQLAGEVVVRALGVTFPGPVLGMGLLFAGLLVRGQSGAALDGVADGILRHLSLLFVPAAVGVMQQAGLIAENWLAISAALVASTLLTLIVTVYTFRAVARMTSERA
jgi:holin-like protein